MSAEIIPIQNARAHKYVQIPRHVGPPLQCCSAQAQISLHNKRGVDYSGCLPWVRFQTMDTYPGYVLRLWIPTQGTLPWVVFIVKKP